MGPIVDKLLELMGVERRSTSPEPVGTTPPFPIPPPPEPEPEPEPTPEPVAPSVPEPRAVKVLYADKVVSVVGTGLDLKLEITMAELRKVAGGKAGRGRLTFVKL